MKIDKLVIENFLSIKHAEIDFSKYDGLVRVVGENKDTFPMSSNGAGKSALIEAIVFVLFGKTIRKTTEKSIVNSFTKGKCKVTVQINDNIVITRTKRPPSLVVKVDGKSVTKEGVLKTQQYLEEILNTNYNIFLASIVFGQQNDINFLSCTAEEKRSIIQNFLNITDLFKNRSKIRSLKSKYNGEKRVFSTLEAESLQKANKIKKKIERLKNQKTQAENTTDGEKLKFISKYSFSEIQDIESDKLEREVSLRDLENGLNFLSDNIRETKANIKYFKENSICEHCSKQPKAMVFKAEESKKCLDSLYNKRNSQRKSIKLLKKEIDFIFIPISSQDFELIESLKSIETETKILKKLLKEQQSISRKYSNQMKEVQTKYEIMRFWELAFSEQGLIKYIIHHILDFFNKKSNYYLSILSNNSFSIIFDELLDESITLDGTRIYYDCLSGGEKKKISLSVMLALNDLLFLSGKDKADMIFFDEVGDSLDKEGIKGLHELIEQISSEKKLFLITHNQYLSSLIGGNSTEMLVQKKNNITEIN